MEFQAHQVGELEGFVKQGADIFDVFECARGAGVGFAAVNDVVADGEVVIEAGRLGGGARDEGGKQRFEGVELAGVNLEIGVDADNVGGGLHRGEVECVSAEESGAPVRTRTGNQLIKSQLLYQLSYRGNR